MADDTTRQRADARLEEALARDQLADPRPHFRDRLRLLRERNPAAFEQAIGYFENTLIPHVAEGGEAAAAWLEYGRRLGELAGGGEIVAVDETGRARPLRGEAEAAALLLHVPEDPATPVLALRSPAQPSAAQRATLDLLVNRKLMLSG
jgi:hypothetical protein